MCSRKPGLDLLCQLRLWVRDALPARAELRPIQVGERGRPGQLQLVEEREDEHREAQDRRRQQLGARRVIAVLALGVERRERVRKGEAGVRVEAERIVAVAKDRRQVAHQAVQPRRLLRLRCEEVEEEQRAVRVADGILRGQRRKRSGDARVAAASARARTRSASSRA